MKLSNYAPAGNEILLELKEFSTTPGGLAMVKPQHDKIMKVLKVGPTVTILNPLTGKTVVPGDYAFPGSPNMMQLTFQGDDGVKIETVQTKEFGIIAFYKPSDDEKKYFADGPVVADNEPKPEGKTRELNIIDNPGIENGSYLKEETNHLQSLEE